MRLPRCPSVICNDLPGGVQARELQGETPSLTRLMRGETEGHDDLIDPDLFAGIARQPLVEYVWPEYQGPAPLFPMLSTDASLIAALYAVPLSEVRPYLPATARLRPARITPWHTGFMVFALDCRRSGLGRYHELGVAVPMLLDAPLRPPLWPLLRERLRPQPPSPLGWFSLELPVDRERSREAGTRLYGLPRLQAQAELALSAHSGLAGFRGDGQRMASLEVSAPQTFTARRMDLSFTTLSLLDDRIVRTCHATLAEGYRGPRGTAKLEFGEHPRFARFRSLTLTAKPLEIRVCPRLNGIVGGPQDMGRA